MIVELSRRAQALKATQAADQDRSDPEDVVPEDDRDRHHDPRDEGQLQVHPAVELLELGDDEQHHHAPGARSSSTNSSIG